MDQKTLIEGWIKLYDCLNSCAYAVIEWPDENERNRQAIDALCEDALGNRLAIEHTLIQPFTGAKEDDARFLLTVAGLEDNPELIVAGFTIHVSQPVAAIPKGIQWSILRQDILDQLREALPTFPTGASEVEIVSRRITVPLTVWKNPLASGENPTFKTGRIWPGDPGPELVLAALRAKIPKLSQYTDAKKILLLEKYAIAGTIESQFEKLPMTPEIQEMLQKIDAIWSVNTAGFEFESVIFTNDIWPTLRTMVGSLNLVTNEFWQLSR
jgi:hypothetical protein